MAEKHTLFLVHGMGRHEGPEWAQVIWDKLVDCSLRYPHFRDRKPLDQYAEPFAVEYDSHIRRALKRWEDSAEAFGVFARANEIRGADSLEWLDAISNADAGFLSSHVLDVVIYRYFKHEAGRIQDTFKRDVFREVARRRKLDAGAKFSLMAHSLGTSVAHDSLGEIAVLDELDALQNVFQGRHFKFESIHMLANVSRVLETKPKAYDSAVRPGPSNANGRCTRRMYSHRHELDPFTRARPFEPVGWGAALGPTKALRHYRGWNIHGWLHYLDAPQVHIPVLRHLAKPSSVTPAQERELLQDSLYPKFGGDLAELDTARARIEALHQAAQGVDEERSISENLGALKTLWQGLLELKDLAGETWAKLERSMEQ